MRIVDSQKKFKFKKLCPYCGANMTYVATGWSKHPAKQFWKADSVEGECHSEPDIDSEEWDEWLRQHSDMPYVHQLPVDRQVRRFINSKFRFRI